MSKSRAGFAGASAEPDPRAPRDADGAAPEPWRPGGTSGDGRILIGVIGAPHGVKGEVRIKSFAEDPVALARYGALSDEAGRTFTVLGARAIKDDMVVARLEGVLDRDAAQRLTSLKLYLDRARLPAPAEEEFYHADLVGLEAVGEDGRALGRVAGVENYGGGDLLAIRPAGGEAVLVPFTRAFVPVIDLAGRRLVVAAAAIEPDPVQRPDA